MPLSWSYILNKKFQMYIIEHKVKKLKLLQPN